MPIGHMTLTRQSLKKDSYKLQKRKNETVQTSVSTFKSISPERKKPAGLTCQKQKGSDLHELFEKTIKEKQKAEQYL